MTRRKDDETAAEEVGNTAGASTNQGRKSYACWLEDADVQPTLIEMLLGHGVKDISKLYKKRHVTKFLAEVREKMLKHIGTEPTLALMKTHGIVAGPIAQEA